MIKEEVASRAGIQLVVGLRGNRDDGIGAARLGLATKWQAEVLELPSSSELLRQIPQLDLSLIILVYKQEPLLFELQSSRFRLADRLIEINIVRRDARLVLPSVVLRVLTIRLLSVRLGARLTSGGVLGPRVERRHVRV